jgi:hypothetical protein
MVAAETTTPECHLRQMALDRAQEAGEATEYAVRRRLEQEALRLWNAARAAARVRS